MQQAKTGVNPLRARGTMDEVVNGTKERILVADDHYEMCRLIVATLRKAGYNVTMCTSGINLLSHLGSYLLEEEDEEYALIITDIRMPGITGLEVLEGLNRVEEAPPVILITAFGDEETHKAAARLGAVTVLDKPFEMGSLLKLVQKTLARRQAR